MSSASILAIMFDLDISIALFKELENLFKELETEVPHDQKG